MVLSISAFGQNHFIGLKSGISWTNVSSSNSEDINNNLPGLMTGLTYSYHLKQHITFDADLLYAQRGYSSSIVLFSGNPEEVKIDGEFNYDYISLPLKAGLVYGKRISGFANVGIIPSFLINANSTLSSPTNSRSYNLTNLVTRFDFAGLIEIGASLDINNRILINSSLEYQHSFTSTTNSEYRADDTIKHYGMILSIGLKYALTIK